MQVSRVFRPLMVGELALGGMQGPAEAALRVLRSVIPFGQHESVMSSHIAQHNQILDRYINTKVESFPPELSRNHTWLVYILYIHLLYRLSL